MGEADVGGVVRLLRYGMFKLSRDFVNEQKAMT